MITLAKLKKLPKIQYQFVPKSSKWDVKQSKVLWCKWKLSKNFKSHKFIAPVIKFVTFLTNFSEYVEYLSFPFFISNWPEVVTESSKLILLLVPGIFPKT